MHFLALAIILLAIYFYFLYQNSQASKNKKSNDDAQPVHLVNASVFNGSNLAYLSKGKLFSKNQQGEIEEIQSTYIQKQIDRKEQKQHQHGWKQGTSWETTPMGGVREFDGDNIDINFTSAEFLPDNKLLYFLKGDGFGGLFRYDVTSKEELRISHRQNLDYLDLRYSAKRKKILCSSNHGSGISNIVLMDEDGDSDRELTGGDTEDISPCWLADSDNQIVFQSMGLARSGEGFVVARGPASIQLLDIDKEVLTPVLRDDNFDYIDPKVSEQGDLYFIRRPFEAPHYKTSNFLMDALLFPFRLSRAVFHYLNFFSLMYSREALTSASSPYVEADLKDIMLKGKRIDAEKALKKGHSIQGVPSLVPKSWELVCRNKKGEEKVLANCVSSYDMTEGGKIIYSNGCGVFALDDNASSLILRDKLVTEVIA